MLKEGNVAVKKTLLSLLKEEGYFIMATIFTLHIQSIC